MTVVNQGSTVCTALRRQQMLWCNVYPSSSPSPWGSVQLPLFPQLVEMILQSANSLHHQCLYKCFYFINVRDSGAFPYVNLSFELGFHKEGKCDGMGPATGNYWSSAVIKGTTSEKVFTAWWKIALQGTFVGELRGKRLRFLLGADQGEAEREWHDLLSLGTVVSAGL